eukprot:455353-Prorocentrum_minimum.AAC.1
MGAPHRWARMGTCYHSLVNTLLFWQAQVIHPAHGCVSARSSCCRPRSQLVIARSAHAKYPIDDGWTRRVLSRVLACITLPPGEVVLPRPYIRNVTCHPPFWRRSTELYGAI